MADTHEDDVMIMIICLPLVITVLSPYLIWCAARDTGCRPWVAGALAGWWALMAGLAVWQGFLWQAALASAAVGGGSILVVIWASRKARRESGEKVSTSDRTWRFS